MFSKPRLVKGVPVETLARREPADLAMQAAIPKILSMAGRLAAMFQKPGESQLVGAGR